MTKDVDIYCIICGEKTDKVISPDIDCQGIPACERHVRDVRFALLMEFYGQMKFEQYIKNLKKKEN